VRTAILVTALLFALAILAGTVDAIRRSGFDVISAAALVVVALFLFGIVGALRNPPDP
jgi:Na+-transporting NADH:ubiquinone oxidoreductase subunit NqrB